MPFESPALRAVTKDLEGQLTAKEDGMDVVPVLRLSVSPSPGETVRLRGGGPAMTVVSARNDVIEVVWFAADGSLHKATIPATCLTYVLAGKQGA